MESIGRTIEEWMRPYDFPFDVEQIIDVDRFILDGIQSVPSVKVIIEANLEQRDFATAEDFVSSLGAFSKDVNQLLSKMVQNTSDVRPGKNRI